MRIRRIRLRNYRGVEDREVVFTDGVTVVEGPNEVGKSSLHEALDLLFDYYDNSRHRDVLATQPVDRDVGPEVEADLECGPYAFTYRKRFVRRPETVLKITAPAPEQLTGRAAHERVESILSDTIDDVLWDALRVQQGAAIGQQSLARAPSLSRALDQAAGQEVAGERELTLFDAVQRECRKYFTEASKPKKTLVERARTEEEAARRVAELASDLRALEKDIERSARLEREIADSEREVAESEANLEKRRGELHAMERREEEVKKLGLAATASETLASAARRDMDERARLVQRSDEAKANRARLEAEAAERKPALKEAEEEYDAARWNLAAAEEQARQAERLFQLTSKDLDYHHAKLDLEQLLERRGRIQETQRRAAEAQELLDKTRVTDDVLRRIDEAHLKLVGAQARLDAGSPRLRVRAEMELEVALDGAPRRLEPGDAVDFAVAESAALEIPGVMEVTFDAGTGTSQLAAERDAVTRALDALLGEAGAESVEAARSANESRRRAQDTLDQSKVLVKQDLRDLTLVEMEAKIERLRRWETYPLHERPPDPPLAEGYEGAKEARQEAKEARRVAEHQLADARQREENARTRRQDLLNRVSEVDIKLSLASDAAKAAAAEVAAARRERRDAVVEAECTRAIEKAAADRDLYESERRALQAAHPERVRRLAENAERATEQAHRLLRDRQDELQKVRARLDLQGEKGFFSELERARTRHERALHEKEAADRRAEAARLLFETMADEREKARRAYAAPLRERIVRLGRLMFDKSFDVELDPDLRIARRTLFGRTLPFEHLSIGTQEQLSLISRLACALLVDEAEGVPLILDDTLGHSDPHRLEGMGAMLSRTGERCQVIVLTCTPGRFRHVGGANVVRL